MQSTAAFGSSATGLSSRITPESDVSSASTNAYRQSEFAAIQHLGSPNEVSLAAVLILDVFVETYDVLMRHAIYP